MKIVSGLLVRNEEGRYLESVLQEVWKVSNRVMVLDDFSEDNTAKICERYGCEIDSYNHSLWGKDEVVRRMQLFKQCKEVCSHGDYIMIIDADEIPTNIHLLPEFLMQLTDKYPAVYGSVGFRLFDMWNQSQYRDDKYWQAHSKIWEFLIRYDSNAEYGWRKTALHCGRFPVSPGRQVFLMNEIKIKHMGWATEGDRVVKYDRYMNYDSDGKYGEIEQYKSILDDTPHLEVFYE
jgi:glycosyltransferase involved in cell wall biosynthesis